MIIGMATTGDHRIDLEITVAGRWSVRELSVSDARKLIAGLTAVVHAAERGGELRERMDA